MLQTYRMSEIIEELVTFSINAFKPLNSRLSFERPNGSDNKNYILI